MESARMNYYFTTIIIALLCLMTFFVKPAYPRNEDFNRHYNVDNNYDNPYNHNK